jgi:transposase
LGMPIRPEDVPSDPARLAAMVLALDAENESLRAIVRTLKDLLFGARSEKAAVIDVAQLPLDLDDLAVGPTPPPPPAKDEGGTERKGGAPAGRRCATSARFPSICRGARR